MSSGAAFHLPPAFPERAAWGTASKLRAWQQEALDRYLLASPRDFLAVATPGAGKTTYALRVATELLSAGVVERVTVVAPTEHLKTQWADAAARVGISLDPKFSNSIGSAQRGLPRRRRHLRPGRLAPLAPPRADDDPPHPRHPRRGAPRRRREELGRRDPRGLRAGHAAALAHRDARSAPTPPRSPSSPTSSTPRAPCVSSSDYTYGYAEALRDSVVRPVLFLAYGGSMRWRTKAGDELEANLGEPMTRDMVAHAWRTALDPKGEWIPAVLAAADTRLTEVRRHVEDAGGLVIASNQTQARAYAAILRALTGEAPTVVLSDDAGSSRRIEEFGESDARWMVAVRMVSEGVDVPRLCVGVYATSTSTPLFFAQAVGRFVRARRRGETASVFLPSVPVVLDHASRLEEQRDHALDRAPNPEDVGAMWAQEQDLIDEANREAKAVGADEGSFEALESDAHFDHVLFDKQQWGMHAQIGSEDEQDYLGLPGLLEPDQVTALLHERQNRQVKKGPAPQGAPVAAHRALAAQRKELNQLVAAYARQKGFPHANVHADLRRACGGPDLAAASSEQVLQRVDKVRLWLVGRR